METSGDIHEVLIPSTEDGVDTGKESGPDSSSPTHPTGSSLSYDRFRNPAETEESKHPVGDVTRDHQSKAIHGTRDDGQRDPCNNVAGVSMVLVHPPSATPSAMEDGLPEMYPRDADVLPTAILMTCCCPVCGCMAISLARKARRLRQAGKYHASAQASEDSTWWAWSAALAGCFILLGFALSLMIFLLLIYV